MMTWQRHPELAEFVCGQCARPKKSKIRVVRQKSDGTTDVICNGCYGTILSREDRANA